VRAESVNHTQLSISRVGAQLQWSAVRVHAAFTWPRTSMHGTSDINTRETSRGVIYVDIRSWCQASLPRPTLRRPVIVCTTDSTGLMMLVQKLQFRVFDILKSEFLQHAETSRYEQRKQVVSYHTLIFSTVKYCPMHTAWLTIIHCCFIFPDTLHTQ
jgi:hypothetical protein